MIQARRRNSQIVVDQSKKGSSRKSIKNCGKKPSIRLFVVDTNRLTEFIDDLMLETPLASGHTKGYQLSDPDVWWEPDIQTDVG